MTEERLNQIKAWVKQSLDEDGGGDHFPASLVQELLDYIRTLRSGIDWILEDSYYPSDW